VRDLPFHRFIDGYLFQHIIHQLRDFFIHIVLSLCHGLHFLFLGQPCKNGFLYHFSYSIFQLISSPLHLPDRSFRSLLPGFIFLLGV
jgi:hypothetical protein